MFLSCMLIGYVLFWEQPLGEYAVFIASFVATMAELWEPLGINDNLTIPLLSGVTLRFGLERISSICSNCPTA